MKRLISAAALALLALAVQPAARSEASGFPSAPKGVHVTALTHTSFTVGLTKSTNASGYRLYVSRTKSDTYVSNIKTRHTTSALHVFSSSTPSIDASGLTYTTDPYYYRVVAVNGANRAFDPNFHSVGLRPSTPTSFHAASRHLLWASGAATGFTVQWATDAAISQNVATKSITGEAHQYTPYGLRSGTTYYFRVRAVTQKTPGSWTSSVAMNVTTHEQTARVMTYNIMQTATDGTLESGNRLANWVPGRRDAAAALIESVNPDILAVDEGNDWVGDPANHLRQVDSLNNAINGGGTYTVAATELRCCTTGWARTGDYILYKPNAYAPYAAGGHFSIGTTPQRWAAYQPLENLATGAKFLFVSTHLVAGPASADITRKAEAAALLKGATDVDGALPETVPIVYAGDFNSNPVAKQHPLDAPAIAMREAHIADARDVSPTHTNEQYDSENEYSRTPLAFSIFIDYIWAGPDISVASWGQALHLSGGKFVGTIPSDHNPVYAQIRFPY